MVLSATVAEAVLTFGLHVVLARLLGLRGYGVYAVAYGLFRLGQRCAVFGMHEALVKFGTSQLARGSTPQFKSTILTSLGITTFIGILIAGGLCIVSLFIPHLIGEKEAATAICAMAPAVPANAVMLVLGFGLRADGRAESEASVKLLFSVLHLGFAGALVLLGFGVEGAIIGLLVSSSVGAVVAGYLLRNRLRGTGRWIPRWPTLRRVAGYGLHSTAANLAYLGTIQLVPLFLASLASLEAAGVYNAGARIYGLIVMAYSAAKAVYDPEIVTAVARADDAMLRRDFLAFSEALLAFGLLGVAGTSLFGAEIMGIFGSDYASSSAPLLMLSLGALLLLAGGPAIDVLILSGSERLVVANHIVGLLVSAFSIVMFAPRYGAAGGAAGVLFSHMIIGLAAAVEARWQFRLPVLHTGQLRQLTAVVGGLALATVLVMYLALPWPLAGLALVIGHAAVLVSLLKSSGPLGL